MSALSIRTTLCAAVLVSLVSGSLLAAPFSGTVQFQGKQWTIADAVAVKGVMGIELLVSPQPFDRKEWVSNGKFDTSDPYNFGRNDAPLMLKIEFREDGSYRDHEMTQGRFAPAMGSRTEAPGALKLSQQDEQKVVGRFEFKDSDYAIKLSFDLPILQDGQALARPGAALPADGGEPGKALLATLAATATGDKAQILALAPTDKRQMMQAAMDDKGWPKMLASMQLMAPTAITISGGNLDGDTAWVDFTGTMGGKAMRGNAVLVLADGRWYMRRLNTQQ